MKKDKDLRGWDHAWYRTRWLISLLLSMGTWFLVFWRAVVWGLLIYWATEMEWFALSMAAYDLFEGIYYRDRTRKFIVKHLTPEEEGKHGQD